MNLNFIEVTELREPIGIEEVTNYKSLLNADQIVLIRPVEPRIAKELGYNTVIVTNVDRYCILETMEHIRNQISWLTIHN
jgi:hypothetical protein